jgi:ribonuclease HI
MRNNLIVLIDSSTKREHGKYGESTIAWAAWWNQVKGTPLRAELIYLKKEGPNKAFYDGVIRILQSCWYICHPEDKLTIYGDCKIVINHINNENPSGTELMPFYRQVKKIEQNYRCPVKYKYIPRGDPKYSKIDNLVKRGRGLFRNLKI